MITKADRAKIAGLRVVDAVLASKYATDTAKVAYNAGIAAGYREAARDLLGDKFEEMVRQAFEAEIDGAERALIEAAEEHEARSNFVTNLIIAR